MSVFVDVASSEMPFLQTTTQTNTNYVPRRCFRLTTGRYELSSSVNVHLSLLEISILKQLSTKTGRLLEVVAVLIATIAPLCGIEKRTKKMIPVPHGFRGNLLANGREFRDETAAGGARGNPHSCP